MTNTYELQQLQQVYTILIENKGISCTALMECTMCPMESICIRFLDTNITDYNDLSSICEARYKKALELTPEENLLEILL